MVGTSGGIGMVGGAPAKGAELSTWEAFQLLMDPRNQSALNNIANYGDSKRLAAHQEADKQKMSTPDGTQSWEGLQVLMEDPSSTDVGKGAGTWEAFQNNMYPWNQQQLEAALRMADPYRVATQENTPGFVTSELKQDRLPYDPGILMATKVDPATGQAVPVTASAQGVVMPPSGSTQGVTLPGTNDQGEGMSNWEVPLPWPANLSDVGVQMNPSDIQKAMEQIAAGQPGSEVLTPEQFQQVLSTIYPGQEPREAEIKFAEAPQDPMHEPGQITDNPLYPGLPSPAPLDYVTMMQSAGAPYTPEVIEAINDAAPQGDGEPVPEGEPAPVPPDGIAIEGDADGDGYIDPPTDFADPRTEERLTTRAEGSEGSYLPGGGYLPGTLDELKQSYADKGQILHTNGYIYEPDGNGGYTQVGHLEGFTPEQLYTMSQAGVLSDPALYEELVNMPTKAEQQASAKTGRAAAQLRGILPGVGAAPKEPSIYDRIVDGAGKYLSTTAWGFLGSNLFPDFWNGTGDAIKSLDDGMGGTTSTTMSPQLAALMGPSYSMPPETLAPTFQDPAQLAPPPATDDTGSDDDSDEDDDGSDGSSGYDRYGNVVFPDMPPYRPGIDGEWLYFREHGYAEGGIVDALNPPPPPPPTPGGLEAAMAPPVDTPSPLSGQDPRVALIADTEDALEETIVGGKPSPEGQQAMMKFIDTFGQAAFERLFANVRAGKKMRKGGGKGPRMIKGEGGPKDDKVPAVIDDVQEARLSSGEFVWPAESVAAIGEGDPLLGARRLQELNDRLTGKPTGPKPVQVENVG